MRAGPGAHCQSAARRQQEENGVDGNGVRSPESQLETGARSALRDAACGCFGPAGPAGQPRAPGERFSPHPASGPVCSLTQ